MLCSPSACAHENRGQVGDFLITITKYPTGAIQGNKSLFWCMIQRAQARSGDRQYRLGVGLLHAAAITCSDMLHLGKSGYREVWLKPEAAVTFKD